MRIKGVATGLLVLTAIGVTACSKPPEQAMQAGSAALEEAKAAGAEMYATTELQQAQDLLNRAEAEKKAQDDKFAPFRSYDESAKLYGEAQVQLDAAKQAAAAAKEQARADATQDPQHWRFLRPLGDDLIIPFERVGEFGDGEPSVEDIHEEQRMRLPHSLQKTDASRDRLADFVL